MEQSYIHIHTYMYAHDQMALDIATNNRLIPYVHHCCPIYSVIILLEPAQSNCGSKPWGVCGVWILKRTQYALYILLYQQGGVGVPRMKKETVGRKLKWM